MATGTINMHNAPLGAPSSSKGSPQFALFCEEYQQRLDALTLDPGNHRSRETETILRNMYDGLVTRESQLGRGQFEGVGAGIEAFSAASSFFLCERHDQLSVNPYFQNNLLHFLLAP